MASAAAAKKCPRPAQSGPPARTHRLLGHVGVVQHDLAASNGAPPDQDFGQLVLTVAAVQQGDERPGVNEHAGHGGAP